MEEKETRSVLVLGDLHGHLDRFEALLLQEGLVERCPKCQATGDVWDYSLSPPSPSMCPKCDGQGWARTDKLVDVVLVGDVGHFGQDASPTGDLLTWQAAYHWADVILWGNHDRALVSKAHQFRGYFPPFPETTRFIEMACEKQKMKLAHAAHGFLITHAGLHYAFRNLPVDKEVKQDAYAFAEWINQVEPWDVEATYEQLIIRDAVSSTRGGSEDFGGILWRDINESLYFEFRQVFGHTADHKEQKVRACWENTNKRIEWRDSESPQYSHSYCVDIGGKDEHCLAGIYLPSEKIVQVNLNKKQEKRENVHTPLVR